MKLAVKLASPLCPLALLLACSNPPPPAAAPSGDLIPLAESSARPASTPTSADPAPAASSAAPATSAKAPRPAAGGSPMVVSEGDKEVSAPNGAAGGIMRVGGTADLIVPRGALEQSLGFVFALNVGKNMLKITPYKGQLGDVYRVFVFREEASNQGIATTSLGPPFQLKLPLKGAKTANLVVATAEGAKAKYTIIAPRSVVEADTGASVLFDLPTLPGEAILHLTSAPPS